MQPGLNTFTLRCAALGLLVFLGVTFVSVILRFGFSAGFVALDDLQRYAVTLFVPLAILYAALENKHVRADLQYFRTNRYLEGRAFQLLFVVLPCLFLAVLFLPVVLLAWQSLEGSSEPQGLGGYFLVKTIVPVAFALIAVYGVRRMLARRGFGSISDLSRNEEGKSGDD